MRRIRTYHEIRDPAGAEVVEQVIAQRRRLEQRLAHVGRTVVVASGKGGVGKSLVTANLAAALAARGARVGAADADLNGPSLARMLGAAGRTLAVGDDGIEPAEGAAGVRVMSMDLLLASDDAPLRWRAPDSPLADGADFLWQSTLETGTLREFLTDTAWGTLDDLLIDVPPGTDKLARVLGLIPAPDAVLIVTTPSEIARAVVARSVRMAQNAAVPVLGLVANMTSHVCSGCGRAAPLFEADGARRLAEAADVPLWVEIPFDAALADATDRGRPLVLERSDSPAAAALRRLAERLTAELHETGRPL